jgi:DNA-binding response OmpR family regulator
MEKIEKVKKVLIVDSDTSYTIPLRNALSKARYEVICGDDGQKAVEMAKNLEVDMIISEVELPQTSGHTLYKGIRSIPACNSIAFIFISSQKRVDDRIKSMELGVDDYITKPFYAEEIVARVDALFAEISQINEEQSQSEKDFSGSLTEMNLVDLIQTLELGKKSAILKLTHNSSIGMIYVMNGEVVDALLDDLAPNQSLMRMFTWNIGNFFVEMASVNRERTIHIPNKELITNAMRRINQWEQIQQGLPPLNTVVIKTELNTYENLSDEEKEILNAINEKKKICEIIEKSHFDDLKSLAIVKGLYQKGYLHETEDSYISYPDNYLAQLKKNASNAKSTRDRVASIIANVFKNSGNGDKIIEEQRNERRQLPDRRRYGRRREDRQRESNQIHLSKTELLLIRERLS